MEISMTRNILERNTKKSDELKALFKDKGVLVLNIISSPGSGKTSLLERTLSALKGELNMAVVEGDVMTDNDAQRVAATGAQAVQINTEGGCHLDSSMVSLAVDQIDLEGLDILFVENVGNLVCPAEFEVGEDAKVAMLSVTEGDDKPQKYPLLFEISSVMVLNKTDLLPYVDFDMEKASNFARKLNADIAIFAVSCRTGEGLESWYDWLRARVKEKKKAIEA